MSPACSIASFAAATARRSVREYRFVFGRSTSASAAMSVGKVSPGKRVIFPIPARDSTIDSHTSALFRPMEQTIPAPVTAMRMLRSGLRTSGQIKPAPHGFYSIHESDSAEAERAAEIGLEGDGADHDVARFGLTKYLAAVDA